MAATAPERVAVLLVRTWHDGEGAQGLRARITWVMDVETGPEHTIVVAGTDDILAAVRRWLDRQVAARRE